MSRVPQGCRLPVANRQDCLLRECLGSARLRPVAEAPWEQKSHTHSVTPTGHIVAKADCHCRVYVISLTDRKTTLRYQTRVRHWLALSRMLLRRLVLLSAASVASAAVVTRPSHS